MGINILLVDDDDLILLTTGEYLSQEGFEVETAESGEDAINKLDKNSSYDLVVTDLRMYGETGVDVFKKVLEVNANIPVIIVTGFGGETPMFKEAMELKPCAHAFKPFSEEELLEKVRKCLERC
jgi:two-component system, NtrC family, C4-dicarboxylate transport response regulator DctD